MPSSNVDKIPMVIRQAQKFEPHKILDVGVGFGKYGMLLREYLELLVPAERQQDPCYLRSRWTRTIHGIEIFGDFLQDWHRCFYDEIFVGDVREILPTLLPDYDLVLLCDVLEHMDMPEALAVLYYCERISAHVIVSLPAGEYPQEKLFGNEHEKHRSTWYAPDLSSRGYAVQTSRGEQGPWLVAWR